MHCDLGVGADFASLTQLSDAIHGNGTAGDQLLARTTAVTQAGQFQQLVEFDVVGFQFEFEVCWLHCDGFVVEGLGALCKFAFVDQQPSVSL